MLFDDQAYDDLDWTLRTSAPSDAKLVAADPDWERRAELETARLQRQMEARLGRQLNQAEIDATWRAGREAEHPLSRRNRLRRGELPRPGSHATEPVFRPPHSPPRGAS